MRYELLSQLFYPLLWVKTVPNLRYRVRVSSNIGRLASKRTFLFNDSNVSSIFPVNVIGSKPLRHRAADNTVQCRSVGSICDNSLCYLYLKSYVQSFIKQKNELVHDYLDLDSFISSAHAIVLSLLIIITWLRK